MKLHYCLFGMFTLACLPMASGEEGISLAKFVKLSPESAAQVLKEEQGTYSIRQYVEAAFGSKRLDLINVCLQNNYGGTFALDIVSRMPESIFRDTVLIMMIESGTNFWGKDGDPNEREGSGGLNIKRTKVDEPFASLIKRLLPDHPLDPALFEWHSKRLKLGAELRAALNVADPSGKKAVMPVRELEKQSAAASATQEPQTLNAETKPADDTKKQTSSGLRALWIALIVVAVAIPCLILKKRAARKR